MFLLAVSECEIALSTVRDFGFDLVGLEFTGS
jgi:hypothetical protein